MKFGWAYLTILVLVLCYPTSSFAERYALIVGVDGYTNTAPLKNAVNDALAIEKKLLSLGFKRENVTVLQNSQSSRIGIQAAWQNLAGRVTKDDVVVFFFAGHGMQIDGTNFIVPQDMPSDFFREGLLSIREMLDDLTLSGDEPKLVLFIVDACRDNPWGIVDTFGQRSVSVPSATPGAPKSISKRRTSAGLGPVLPPKNVFVMHSAGIGQQALDGLGNNSVFTEALLRFLGRSGWTLSDVAQELRFAVYRKAQSIRPGHVQTPAYYDQLQDRYDLNGIRPTRAVRKFEFREGNRRLSIPSARQLTRGDVLIEHAGLPELVVVQVPNDDSRKFAIGRYEVTNAEWNNFAASKKCKSANNSRVQRDNRDPISFVSWHDAQSYTKWLSCLTGEVYRLPTSDEWEIAARGGATGTYFFQASAEKDHEQLLCLYANGADLSMKSLFFVNDKCDDGSRRGVTAVGSYLPNAIGLHDVLGNVWEWVTDCAHQEDDGGACTWRIARGGSWRTAPGAMTVEAAHKFPSEIQKRTLGFRVLRELK